ncbi:MAG: hypothetical protein HZA95_01085 [Candidatus Vogelbacteria bacterium]|nr:hypothetical protein [Candidatus Vogelbacteria bacterium]
MNKVEYGFVVIGEDFDKVGFDSVSVVTSSFSADRATANAYRRYLEKFLCQASAEEGRVVGKVSTMAVVMVGGVPMIAPLTHLTFAGRPKK